MRDPHAAGGMLARLSDIVEGAGYATLLLGQALLAAVFIRRPRQSFARLMEQFYVQIVKSIGVVSLVAVFTGMILTLQLGQEIAKYGGEGEIGTVIAAVMAREMGPFITGIILAATVGSSIAAEVGTMRVSEEIDALEIMNIDPIRFLVMPRVISLACAGFLLTILVDLVGVLGGAVVAHAQFPRHLCRLLRGRAAGLQQRHAPGCVSEGHLQRAGEGHDVRPRDRRDLEFGRTARVRRRARCGPRSAARGGGERHHDPRRGLRDHLDLLA